MAYNTILYEVSHRTLTVPLNRSDRLSAFTTEMGREPADALVPLLVDEFADCRPAARDAPQSRVTYAAGSSP